MAETFYCELSDLKAVGVSEAKIIKLAAEDKDTSGILNQENFDGCRRSARTMIDGYCMSRYQSKIPFQPVPELIVTIATLLTKFYLYSRKNQVDKQLQKSYDDQILLLKGIAKGVPKLFEDTTGVVSEDSVLFTEKKPEDRAFHPSNIPGYLP